MSDQVIVAGNIGQVVDGVAQRYADYGYRFSLLVAKDDQILLQKGYGSGVTPETVFNVASVAKQFTATAIVKLASQGKLRLSDPVTRFFPEAPAAFQSITIDHLLSHASGIRDDYSVINGFATRQELLNHIFSHPLESRPGAEWSYCNFCYGLLAIIVERASGRSYKDYLRDALFAPAGLRHTGFRGDPHWTMAQWPRATGGIVPEYPREDRWGFGLGSTDVVTSPADLLRWMEALRSGRIVPEQWRTQLDEPLIDVTAGLKYGRGWWTRKVTVAGSERLNLWHSGQEEVGYSAWLNQYPDDRLLTVFATNQAFEGQPLREAFNSPGQPSVLEKLIFGGEVKLPSPVIADADLNGVPGRYIANPGNWFDVRVHSPYVEIVPHGQVAFDSLLSSKPTPKQAELLVAATGRTEKIFSDIKKGIAAPYRGKDSAFEPELFSLTDYEVLGTAPLEAWRDDGSGQVTTFVRVPTSGTDQYWRIRWRNDEVTGVYKSEAPVLPLFRAIAPGQFANWQPFLRVSAFLQLSDGLLKAGAVEARRAVN